MLGAHGRAARDTDNREAAEKFGQARFVVSACWPFLTGAVMRLCPRWTADLPTIAVDPAWRLYMNPDWVARQHPARLALIIAGHELGHVLGQHGRRLAEYNDVWIATDGGQKFTVANASHDLAINSGLQAFVDSGNAYQKAIGRAGAVPLAVPKEGLYPRKFASRGGAPFPEGLVSEEYAALFMAEAAGMGCGPPADGTGGVPSAACGRCGSGAGGGREACEDLTEADPNDYNSGVCEAEQEAVKQRTAQAVREQSSRMRGTVPGGMERWAEVYLTRSRVPWDVLLRRAVRGAVNRQSGQYDWSYAVRNRRNQDSRVILPGMYTPDPKFVVCFDTSGSMGVGDYAAAFGHIAGILKSVGKRKVPVFACDAAAAEVQWVTDVRQIRMTGGGGTDMRVGIDRAGELGYRLVVVASDGETPWPDRKGRADVIACLTQRPGAMPPPWIRTIVQE